jgi:hypothetical protein
VVEGELTPLDFGDQLPTELLECFGWNHVDALVGAFDQVAVLAEVCAIGRGQGHSAFVVELALMRPNEHHSRLTTFQLVDLPRRGDESWCPVPHFAPLCIPKCPKVNHFSPHSPTVPHGRQSQAWEGDGSGAL